MMAKLTEIRWHGRGGQGVKTAAQMTADVALKEGKYSQGFPEYGPERMGAPIRGFTRISDSVIRCHSAIEHPDIVMVVDESLLANVDVCEGLKDGGTVIVNTKKSPAEMRQRLGLTGGKVFTLKATQISIDELGRPIPNTPMLGALIKATGLMTLETVKEDIEHKFLKKLGHQAVDGNYRALDRAHEEVEAE